MMLKTLSRDMSTSFSATTTYSLLWWGLWVLNLISLTSHAPTTRYSNCCFSGRRFWFATHCILLADFQLPARKMYGINFALATHAQFSCLRVSWMTGRLPLQSLHAKSGHIFNHQLLNKKVLCFAMRYGCPLILWPTQAFFSQDHEISWNRSNWRTENTFWKRFNSGN